MNIRPHPTKGKTFIIKFWYQKRHYKKVMPALSAREAQEFGYRWRAQIAAGEWKPADQRPKDLTMREATEKFINDFCKARKKAWRNDLALQRRCDQFFQNKKLSEITPQNVEQFRTWMAQPAPDKPALGPLTVNRHHQFAKAVANKMKLWRLYSGENPFALVRMEDESKYARKRFLTVEEHRRLLEVAHESIKPIIIVGTHTGMRRGDMWNLTKAQVNLDACSLSLPDPKSGRAEWVPINETAYHALEPLVKQAQNPSDRVFDFSNFEKRWHKALKDAGITDCHFHDATRHTAGAWITMTSGSLAATQKILRHKDPKTTMRYAHLAPGHLRQIVNGLDGYLKGQPQQPEMASLGHPTLANRIEEAGLLASLSGS